MFDFSTAPAVKAAAPAAKAAFSFDTAVKAAGDGGFKFGRTGAAATAFGSMPSSLRGDRAVALAALGRSWRALAFVPEALRADPAVGLVAVQQAGFALEYLADAVQRNPAACAAAVAQNRQAIAYVHEDGGRAALLAEGATGAAAEAATGPAVRELFRHLAHRVHVEMDRTGYEVQSDDDVEAAAGDPLLELALMLD